MSCWVIFFCPEGRTYSPLTVGKRWYCSPLAAVVRSYAEGADNSANLIVRTAEQQRFYDCAALMVSTLNELRLICSAVCQKCSPNIFDSYGRTTLLPPIFFFRKRNKNAYTIGRKEYHAMAIYHLEAKVITRGVGRSVVAAAAYASCSEIYNDYDGVHHDYTKKSGLVHSEVLLPPKAPTEWQDRAELWNAVEAAEKSKDSRLARELIVALPIELQSDEWITMLRNFITENCVDKGMCADFSIHDTDGHNPHAHILLTVRLLDEKGKWQAKTQKEYLCKRGNEERGFTSDEFKTAQIDGWEKQYQYFIGKKKVYMTPSEAKVNGYERVS